MRADGPSFIPGYATPEGTAHFAARSLAAGKVSSHHFRIFQELQLSSLGIGTYLGKPDLETDRRVSAAVVRSVESGVMNVIDTAINYRNSHGEQAVGAAIRSLLSKGEIPREAFFVSSKNGYVADPSLLRRMISEGTIRPSDVASGCNCLEVPFLRDQLGRSRANLGLETLDLLYLHNVTDEHIPDLGIDAFLDKLRDAFRFLEEARRAHHIRYYGLATWDSLRLPPGQLELLSLEDVVQLAERVGGPNHGFRFVQFPFNLRMPEAASVQNQAVGPEHYTLFEAATRLGIGTFSSVPLLQAQLPAPDALEFARSPPGHIAPLVGHKDPLHVEENLALAARPPLSPEAFANRLDRLLRGGG